MTVCPRVSFRPRWPDAYGLSNSSAKRYNCGQSDAPYPVSAGQGTSSKDEPYKELEALGEKAYAQMYELLRP